MFAACFKLCVNKALYSQYACVCVCVCVCVWVCTRACVSVRMFGIRIVSRDKILHCINTLIIISYKLQYTSLYPGLPLVF